MVINHLLLTTYYINGMILQVPSRELTYPTFHGKFGKSSTQKYLAWEGDVMWSFPGGYPFKWYFTKPILLMAEILHQFIGNLSHYF